MQKARKEGPQTFEWLAQYFDGHPSIALFRGQATRISGAILDLTMPHLDGVQTLAQLRPLRADVPVLISSGYSEQDVLLRFGRMKVNGFIPKPYTLSGLRDALAQTLPPTPPFQNRNVIRPTRFSHSVSSRLTRFIASRD